MKTSCKIITTFLIGLLNTIVASYVFANDNKKIPDPDCPTAYLYRGYDYVKGNPAAPTGDPGWRAQVITPKRNDACLYCDAYTACYKDYDSFEMAGEIDYYNRLSEKITVSGGSSGFLKDVSFTGSAEYQYQREDVFGASLVNIQAEGSCQLWEGLRLPSCLDVVFDPNFLNHMIDFPISTEEPGWFNKVLTVFQSFGTHIIGDDFSLGARWTDESLMTQVNYEGLRALEVDIDAAAELSAEFFRTLEASGQYESEEQTELRMMFEGATSKHRALYIGDPPPSDLDYFVWAKTIETPVPIAFSVMPISELLTPKLFPNDPDIELKRVVMEAGYELYCDSVPGCGIPQPPKPPEPEAIKRVSAEEDGKYEFRNSISVSCPTNYQLVSGGCQSEPKADTVYWILASLKPENNAYHCVANKDRSGGNQDFYQGVTANATCLHNDYIKDIHTVTCDASISGEIDSECTAVCPAGYQVTGGGCETNNFHYELPWKVSRSNPYFSTDGSREGWNCRASKDSESDNDTAYRARGYAVCVQYTDDKVVDHEMLTDRSGTAEEETNGIDVLCNTGYDVIGGGCDTLGTRGSNLEWKIVESQPVDNFNNKGWSCVGQKDDGTASFHREIQTDALCVKFK